MDGTRGGETDWARPDVTGGWYPDPTDSRNLRWWDGRGWSGHVARPEPDRLMPLPFGVWWQAALVLVPFMALMTIVALFVELLDAPGWLEVTLSAAVLYTAMALVCRWFVDYHDRRPLRSALGLRVRGVDIGWGLLTYVTVATTNGVLVAIFTVTGIPYRSNLDVDSSADRDWGAVVALIAVAVLVAPILEELFFRGLLLRSLASRLPAPAAIAVQAAVFGLYHLNVGATLGSIGLVILLSAAGAAFGFVALRTGRLGPSILAHAAMNAIAMAVYVAAG